MKKLIPHRTLLRLAKTPLALIAGAALISGCSNLSGLDATSNYSCPAPPGVVCKPMSEVYRSQNQPRSVGAADSANAESATAMRATPPAASFLPGETRPLRSQPKVLRIWVAPYEDTDGDLHEEHRMYLQVDAGRWMGEHHRARIQNAYTPLRAPSTDTSKASQASNAVKSDARAESRPNAPDVFDSTPDTGPGVAK